MMDLRSRYACDECGDHSPDPVSLCAACKSAADIHQRAPSADGFSIPSSVDPDADPLGVCSRCGQSSRRAYSKGLCPDCVSEAEVSR